MRFQPKLIPARIIRRYRRFLADVQFPDGRQETVHCPNSGSMLGCWAPGWEVRLSDHGDGNRKYRYTLEMLHNGRCWIGINTLLTNRLVEEALARDRIPELTGAVAWRREVPVGESRLDFLGTFPGRISCFLEVKSVTLVDAACRYAFPDAVTIRGLKHLHELQRLREAGHRAVLLFVIQRSDGSGFTPAADLDPAYARELRRAADRGVEILACRARVRPSGIVLSEAKEAVFWPP